MIVALCLGAANPASPPKPAVRDFYARGGGLGTERAIGKLAPGHRRYRHSKLFMPFLPSLSRKYSGGSILKHFSEFFGGYVPLRYGDIRRGAVHHQVRQKCLQIRQRLLGFIVPNQL